MTTRARCGRSAGEELSTGISTLWLDVAWPGGHAGAIPAGMASVLNTLVMVALVGTLAVLIAGIFAMTRGGEFNRKWGNKLMRLRVAMQALALALLFLLFMLGPGAGG